MLNRSISSYIVYGIVVLGLIGLVSRIIYSPGQLFKQVFIMAITAGIVYVIYKRLTKGKPEKREQRAFLKAAKRSKKRLKQRSGSNSRDNIASFSVAKSKKTIKPRKKSDIHLTVIEGKKIKEKSGSFLKGPG